MKEVTFEETHKILYDILVDVTNFCEENNINYFLTAGTLLGAIRHKGFIPWDDDIDITMPRADYERFIREYHTDKNYKLLSIKTNDIYYYLCAKVSDENTICVDKPMPNVDMGINIDVFPMDSFNSVKQAKRVYKKTFWFKKIVGRFFVRCCRFILRGLRVKQKNIQKITNKFYKHVDKMSGCNKEEEQKVFAVMVAPINKMPEVFNYEDIFPTKNQGVFEGKVFRIPNNADCVLEKIYGSYMELPPENKRCHKHHHIVYWKE